jgi:thymidylate synthase
MECNNKGEQQYLDLLRRILIKGEQRDGRNGKTWSLFGERIEFDLSEGVVEELLWFLRGSTDAKELQEKNIHIWDGNTSREYLDSVGLNHYEEGELGPSYGFQWRCFGGNYPLHEGGIDQIQYVLKELSTNPHGRRAVLCAWNPKQANAMALVPCHVLYQFYIGEKGLSCQLYCRSQDVCAGTPFNIASCSLLMSLFASLLDIPTHKMILIAGDAHVYDPHVENAKIQIERVPYKFPSLKIKKAVPSKESSLEEKLTWLEGLVFEDFEIENYQCHPALKYEMIA